jgi:hypothetical protein
VPVAKSLFDQQARLLEHLTSGAAIFADRDAPLDPMLVGISRSLLHLEANLSHQKRISKIAAILGRTFELLGDERAAIIREFVDACPPTHLGFIENARQFHGFLCSRRERRPVQPPYVHEVAACELALAEARVMAQDQEDIADWSSGLPPSSIRRRSGVVLLRCAYDIRPIFKKGGVIASPVESVTHLAIRMTRGDAQPKVFELAPAAFDLLRALDTWSNVSFGAISEPEIVWTLAECGLVEMRR